MTLRETSDVEVAEALKEYQELREAEEGKARRGDRTDLTSLNLSEVRTQQKTAHEFNISQQAGMEEGSCPAAVQG
jgi:hypothetical protein